MKKLSTVVGCLLIVRVAVAAPTANEDFVIAEDAKTYTNAVNAANAYTDAALREGLAVAASSATNYTDAVASTLRDDIANAATSGTNHTDAVASTLRDDIANAASSATNYTDAVASTLRDDIANAAKSATNYTDISISPTAPAFSNAVLAVGLGIDTNTVAVINELVDSTHDLPVSGSASVGALLLALAAAVAALKKKLPYEIVSPAVVVANGAETCQLADRAVNSVTLATSAFAPAFPASPGVGRARDFFVRITAASDVTLTLPSGVTVENAAGDIPAIEGGATTILYFSEVAANRFLLKGEAVEAVT